MCGRALGEEQCMYMYVDADAIRLMRVGDVRHRVVYAFSCYYLLLALLLFPREAFDIQSDDHDRHVKQIEQKILSLTANFEAVVEVNGKLLMCIPIRHICVMYVYLC